MGLEPLLLCPRLWKVQIVTHRRTAESLGKLGYPGTLLAYEGSTAHTHPPLKVGVESQPTEDRAEIVQG